MDTGRDCVNVLNGYRERLCECVKWTQGERCVNVLNEYMERLCECVKWIQGESAVKLYKYSIWYGAG